MTETAGTIEGMKDYTVEPVTGRRYGSYLVTGPRATYILIRSEGRPELLFPMNSRGKVAQVKGWSWFTDKDGHLRPWS